MAIPADLVAAVLDRAAGHCEACALPLTGKADLHHRQLRSQGGGHTVANLIVAHHRCHMAIHANPALGYERGLLVAGWDDPAQVAVQPLLAWQGTR